MNQVNSWCRYDPLICVREVAVEATFVAFAYCSLLYLTGGTVPAAEDILKFVVVFGVLTLAARMISDDLGNKIGIVAISGLGSKTVSMLAPRFVGW